MPHSCAYAYLSIRIPDTQVKLDEDKAKYPFVQLNMVHPNMGFDPKKNAQAKLQLSLQVPLSGFSYCYRMR
jgi:hypothetical protein